MYHKINHKIDRYTNVEYLISSRELLLTIITIKYKGKIKTLMD